MRRLLTLIAAVLVIAAVPALRSAGGDADDGAGAGGASAAGSDRIGRVVRVVDGDTIRVRIGSREERVRYIGVDTPESKRPGTPLQCFAVRAAEENERLVGGERVRLVRDVQDRDRFGRLLAYVYRVRDGVFVNAALVRGGFARPLRISPDVRFAARFAALAAEARRAGRGLWNACTQA
ncbi:MAG: micrococcal nuclease [Solirubrobacteraceae bacterium]|nr:micrococcal nuclease [Solirubrobacteraceae bacterium]